MPARPVTSSNAAVRSERVDAQLSRKFQDEADVLERMVGGENILRKVILCELVDTSGAQLRISVR
jgi:hypothetical protein